MPRSYYYDDSTAEKVWLGMAGYLVTKMTRSTDNVRFLVRCLIRVHLKQVEGIIYNFV